MKNPEDTSNESPESSELRNRELLQQARDARAYFLGKRALAKMESTYAEDAFHQKVAHFANEMRRRYPNDVEKAVLFHIIAHSTVDFSFPMTSVDLPGGEIENFIRNEL